MAVSFLLGPTLLLASLVTLFAYLAPTGGAPAAPAPPPPAVEPIVATATPPLGTVEPVVPLSAGPNAAGAPPTPATSVVVRVVPPAQPLVPPPPAPLVEPAPAPPPIAYRPPTATPSPSPTPRLYPTNREVGIIRPDSTPTPVPYTGQKLGSAIPGQIARWEAEIMAAAEAHRLDPNLIAALMQTESAGDPGALSRAGAVGLLQVIDGPTNPAENVLVGTKMLAHNLRLFDEDLELALAAYNAGARNVLRYKGVPPFAETEAHVERTLASYERFRRAS
jgi:soluble lytic murein transglycosylase-like protein